MHNPKDLPGSEVGRILDVGIDCLHDPNLIDSDEDELVDPVTASRRTTI